VTRWPPSRHPFAKEFLDSRFVPCFTEILSLRKYEVARKSSHWLLFLRWEYSGGEVRRMRVGRVMMGVLYVVAGVGHFVATRVYERIVPDYLPAHRELVLISGVAEIAGGVGILVADRYPMVGRAAAWGIVVFLVAVSPANAWMIQRPERFPGIPLWAMWLRMPLQLLLIWWAWRYTRIRDQHQLRLRF
jgi:uncharacterized membrane protein